MGMNSGPESSGDINPEIRGAAIEAGIDTTDDAPISVDCLKKEQEAGNLSGLGDFVCSRFDGECKFSLTKGMFLNVCSVEPCMQDRYDQVAATGLTPPTFL